MPQLVCTLPLIFIHLTYYYNVQCLFHIIQGSCRLLFGYIYITYPNINLISSLPNFGILVCLLMDSKSVYLLVCVEEEKKMLKWVASRLGLLMKFYFSPSCLHVNCYCVSSYLKLELSFKKKTK